MTVTRITPADFVTSQWSGGETRQLAIAPAGAVYADRDFLWRISSATVDLEESVFTALPDYDRYIATLKGSIRVSHDGGEPMTLVPYAVHRFDGGAATKSWGRCVDFNLMLRKGKCEGCLTALRLAENVRVTLPRAYDSGAQHSLLVYCGEGGAILHADGQSVSLARGEAVLVEDPAGELVLESTDMSALMAAEMRGLEG